MITATLSKISDSKFAVHGPLTFETVPDLLKLVKQGLNSSPQVMVDLQDISRADSAGLAFLIEWLRLAQGRNCQLQFINFPTQFKNLITVTGLTKTLGPLEG